MITLKERLFQKCDAEYKENIKNNAKYDSFLAGSFCGLYELIEQAGLEREYHLWQKEKGR